MNQISHKKNYLYTLSSGFGGMILSSMINFIIIPISLNYWRTEKYGIWALITTVLVYLNMSNLGLNTAASMLIAKNPDIKNKFIILKRTRNIFVISVFTMLFCFLILNYSAENWISLLGRIPDTLKSETRWASFMFGIFYLINLPFSLLTSAFFGFQKAYVDNMFSFLATLGNLVTLLIVIMIKGSLITFAAITGIVTLCINFGRFTYFYFFILKKHKIELIVDSGKNENDQNPETGYKNIFVSGMRFFFMAIAGMVIWNTDNFVISHFLGIKEVTPFAVTFKIYYILFSMLAMLNNALLPIMAKELGNDNWEWTNNIYHKFLVVLAIIGGMTWLGGVLFFRDVITWWAGKEGFAGLLTVFALGGYSYLVSMANLNAGILSVLNYTRGLPFLYWIESLLKLSISVVLLKLMGIGGVAMGTFSSSLLLGTWIFPFLLVKRTNHRIRYKINFITKHFVFAILPLLVAGIVFQIIVQSVALRLITGLLIFGAYCFVSYLIVPPDVKTYFKEIFEYIRKSRQFQGFITSFIRKPRL